MNSGLLNDDRTRGRVVPMSFPTVFIKLKILALHLTDSGTVENIPNITADTKNPESMKVK